MSCDGKADPENQAMRFAFFCALMGFSVAAIAKQNLEIEFFQRITLAHKLKFKKSVIGGLSGLFYDPAMDRIFAVSDDRGNISEPRFYQFKWDSANGRITPEKVIFLTVNKTELSHKSSKSSTKSFAAVLDMEGISKTPWGDFLFVNEGDMNHKPRVNPQLIDVKPDGTIVKEFEIPEKFLPEPSGQQKMGVRNNLSFEGLAANPNGKEWVIATEAPLMQEPQKFVRFVQYTMPEAWVLKPGKEWKYPWDGELKEPRALIQMANGIAEIIYLDDHRLLVLERGVLVTGNGMEFRIQIFEVDLTKGEELKKTLVLDLKADKNTGPIENYEGMTLGPTLSDGKRSLILVSDDNFMRNLSTKFLIFKIKGL